ncbi:unnamed protein product [Candida verbasci]|uniref:Uncharacterized protein n=1 Tax=Candida verbasci TaxID=1227364 RepID=A0A9W4TSH5_9ASCO|nr:unnamed protein product [Candida verbasci]
MKFQKPYRSPTGIGGDFNPNTLDLNLNNVPAATLGLISATAVNALPDKDSYTTFDILKVNILRIIFRITLFIYFTIFGMYSTAINFIFLVQVFIFDLKLQLFDFQADPNLNMVQQWFAKCIFYKTTLLSIPLLLFKVFKLTSNTPIGLNSVLRYIPKINTPESISLILYLNPAKLQAPPEIPQPYLDSDKKIKVPSKKDIQYVLAVKSEYMTALQTHNAAERVRLLREIGRFITWCCLVPTIKEISIYERTAACWDGNIVYIDSIKNSILVELISMANTFDPIELKKFKRLLPKIVLVDKFSKSEFIVNESETDLYELQSNASSIQIDEDELPRRGNDTLIVNLCDERIRDTNLQIVKNKIINELDSFDSEDEVFTQQFPNTSQLIIAPKSNSNEFRNKLNGYMSIDNNKEDRTKPIVYFSHLEFGFPFFSRSLYTYSLEFPFEVNQKPKNQESVKEAVEKPSEDNPIERVESNSVLDSIELGTNTDYIVN